DRGAFFGVNTGHRPGHSSCCTHSVLILERTESLRAAAASSPPAGRSRIGHGRVWPDFRLRLRMRQIPEFRLPAALNGDHLAARLETGEIGAVAPGEGAAEANAGAEGGVVHDIDEAFVIRRTLLVAGEIAEIARGREDRGNARNFGDFLRIHD